MDLPISALKNLGLTGVNYSAYILKDEEGNIVAPKPPPSQMAILVVLEDSIGKMQCVLREDEFIDLTYLCETLGRNLKGLPQDACLKIAHALGLESLSSLPGLTNYPCAVSPSVLESDELFFYSGKNSILIQLQHKAITHLFQHSETVNFAQKIEQYLPSDHYSTADDESTIRKAVENFTALRIKQRLEHVLEIPPMPQTSQQIVKLRVDPEAGVAELATVVETDPSLAAQVISWAASPYYAAPGKINSVHDAVIRVLGFDLVINLALGLSLGKTIELPKDGPRGITPYWKQAVYCAATSELIARTIPKFARPEPGLAYLAGLLHNFGYLILGQIFPPHLSLINRYLEANHHVPVYVIEHYLLGLTREQLAAWLFQIWGMPDAIVAAVRWQNNPNYNNENHVYPNVLFLANQILHNHDIGAGPPEHIPQALLSNLKLDEEILSNATQKIWENKEHLDTIASNFSR